MHAILERLLTSYGMSESQVNAGVKNTRLTPNLER